MKRILTILLYGFMVAIFIAVILEAGLRMSGKYQTYSEKIGRGYSTYYGANHSSWLWTYNPSDTFVLDHGEFRYDYITNELGLREKSPDWSDSTEIKLAAFGDSFTEGVGAAYDSTWPREIERRLLDDGYRASVLNAGVSGSDPFYGFQLLRSKVIEYQPSHVIYMVNSNDLEDVIIRSGFDRFNADGTVTNRAAPPLHFWFRHFHLVRWFTQSVAGYDALLIRAKDMEAERIAAAASIKACIDSTYAVCSEQAIKLLLAAHVPPHTLCGPSPPELDVRNFLSWDYNYPFIFLEDQLRSGILEDHCHEYCWKVDGHFNGKGYTMMGEILYREIQQSYPGYFKDDHDLKDD